MPRPNLLRQNLTNPQILILVVAGILTFGAMILTMGLPLACEMLGFIVVASGAAAALSVKPVPLYRAIRPKRRP